MSQQQELSSLINFSTKLNASASQVFDYLFPNYNSVGAPARNPVRIVEEAKATLNSAVNNMHWGINTSGAEYDSKTQLLPYNVISTQGRFVDKYAGDTKVRTYMEVNLTTILASIAIAKGTLTNTRYWIPIEGLFHDNKQVFIGFPDLSTEGNKSCLQTALADTISQMIQNGLETPLIKVAAQHGITIPKILKPFCHAKAVHIKGFPVERRKDHKADMDLFFAWINNTPIPGVVNMRFFTQDVADKLVEQFNKKKEEEREKKKKSGNNNPAASSSATTPPAVPARPSPGGFGNLFGKKKEEGKGKGKKKGDEDNDNDSLFPSRVGTSSLIDDNDNESIQEVQFGDKF